MSELICVTFYDVKQDEDRSYSFVSVLNLIKDSEKKILTFYYIFRSQKS